ACKVVGAEPETVSRAMSLLAPGLRDDLKEWGLAGGSPFGCMCLPKDLEAFISFMFSRGMDVPLLSAVRKVNRIMVQKELEAPEFIVNGLDSSVHTARDYWV